jgi:tetratricopeptide (TPR) repeat protein
MKKRAAARFETQTIKARQSRKPPAPSGSGFPKLGNAILPALLFALTLAAYLPALHGDFLWDDDAHITKPELQSLHGLGRIWTDFSATQQYYPILHSAFWIEHRLWGDAVAGYHLVNILLHACTAWLVVLIVRKLELPGAWLAGFLFALHPVCVEAVAWMSEQKSTLSAVFYLAAALAYLDFDRSRRRSRYFLALGLFLAALLSKTVTSTLPATLLVVFWWQRGRIQLRRDVVPLAPWFALGAGAGLLTAWAERTYIGAHGEAFRLSALDRVLLAGRVIWFYAGKILWPSNLTLFYPRWAIDARVWWQYLFPAGVMVAAVGLAILARRSRGPLAAFLLFAGTLFPALGFFNVYPFFYSWVADHFQYLATLGILVPAAVGLTTVAAKLAERSHLGARAAAASLLAVLAVATWQQSGMYRDNETLYRTTLVRNPGSWLAHNNLAVYLFNVPGGLPEALTHAQAAVADNPTWAEAHLSLGTAYSLSGRLEEAAAEYETTLRIDPRYPHAHSNLGNILLRMPGQIPRAIEEYEAALRDNPNAVETHYNLATVLLRIPVRFRDGLNHLETALRLKPDLEPARRLMERLHQAGYQKPQ